MPLGFHQTAPLAGNRNKWFLIVRRIYLNNENKSIKVIHLIVTLTNLSADFVALSAVKGLREKLDVGVITCLGTFDFNRSTQFNPRHR